MVSWGDMLSIGAITSAPVLYEMAYLIVVAVRGNPVVISGNCMLVELNPRLGFYDIRVGGFWKFLMSTTGL
jgi:hypothetical protein